MYEGVSIEIVQEDVALGTINVSSPQQFASAFIERAPILNDAQREHAARTGV